MSLVSVIIPAYNAEKHLGAAIDSVLAQSWDDLEVIVVDDGSTDDSHGVASSYDDSRIQVIRQNNQGAASARNRGFSVSSGNLIQYLDADDVLEPEKIEKQIHALAAISSNAVATCQWQSFQREPRDSSQISEPAWQSSAPKEWLIHSLLGGGMYQTACWLTPRYLIEAAGSWDETLSLHDDGEFFTRVLTRAESLQVIPETLVHYRSVPLSLSRRRSSDAAFSSLKVSESREHVLLDIEDSKRTRRAIATSYLQVAYEFGEIYPEIQKRTLERIRVLNANPSPIIGGASFRFFTQIFGAKTALQFRSFLDRSRRCTKTFLAIPP